MAFYIFCVPSWFFKQFFDVRQNIIFTTIALIFPFIGLSYLALLEFGKIQHYSKYIFYRDSFRMITFNKSITQKKSQIEKEIPYSDIKIVLYAEMDKMIYIISKGDDIISFIPIIIRYDTNQKEIKKLIKFFVMDIKVPFESVESKSIIHEYLQ